MNVLARLKTLGNSHRRKPRPGPVAFPPPSWVLEDEEGAMQQDSGLPPISDSSHASPTGTQPLQLPDPVSFAMTLKSLIDSLPTEGPWPDKPSQETSKDKGRILAPQPVPPGLDDNLVRLLASEDVMKGNYAGPMSQDMSQDKKSKSNIWNILTGLKDDAKVTGCSKVTEVAEDGFMVCAPLEPMADSQVELAKPEIVERHVEDLAQRLSSTTEPIPKEIPTSHSTIKVVEKQVWHPSTTELSVLTTWWGYRIYLPPPVMAKLGGKAIKATTRAAMIATALKWLLERIPLAIIPAQFRVAVKLLKQLTPLTGYIGVFIAWSWDRVRSFDEGNGVVLTATWILPVALLPMSWDAGDIFRPILPPTPEELKAMQEAAAKAANEVAETTGNNESSGWNSQRGKRNKSLFRW